MSKEVYYADYLQLDKILNAQAPESAKYGETAHDETLFIIIHQTYELWFKQILHEVNSVRDILNSEKVPENSLSTIVARLHRVIEIEKILIDQLNVIETMTPLDFMDFRDYLLPASGFQSLQFRITETALGLRSQFRMDTEKKFFNSRLKKEDRKTLEEVEKQASVFYLIEKWLERMPFAKTKDFDFWADYQESVQNMLKTDLEHVQKNPTLTEGQKALELQNIESTQKSFGVLFDEEEYQKLIDGGKKRLSRKATLSAIFISLYRDEPILALPFQVLTSLVDIDELLTTWRYRHSMMAHRLLGSKIGTGGSSGHEYLKASAEHNRIYRDFFDISSFLIPKSKIPPLPQSIKEKMDFRYQ